MIELFSVRESAASKRAVFLVENDILAARHSDFELDVLAKYGFTVSMWHITTEGRARTKINYKTEGLPFSFEHLCTMRDLRCNLQELTSHDIVIYCLGTSSWDNWRLRKIRRVMLDTKATKVALNVTPVPSPKIKIRTFLQDLFGRGLTLKARNRKLKHVFENHILNRVYGWCTKPAGSVDLLLTTRESPSIDQKLLRSHTKVCATWSLDARACHRVASRERRKSYSYAVYLDGMGTLQPDLGRLSSSFRPGSELFFKQVCTALDFVQEQSGLQVIVAGHPRGMALASNIQERYGRYEVRYKQTAALVQGANLVLGEASTSFGMAAWFDLPAVIIDTSLYPSWMREFGNLLRDELNCSTWNIDNPLSRFQIPTVDRQQYASYCRKYMAPPGTSAKSLWTCLMELRVQPKQIHAEA